MSATVVNLVDTTIERATPVMAQLTGVLRAIFKPVHYLHRLWRWYRRAEVYSNPENFAGLLSGHLINFFGGDNVALRVAAQCVLIATRILQCVQQQIVIGNAYQKLKEAFQGRFAYHMPSQWIKEKKTSFLKSSLSASTIIWIRLTSTTLFVRIHRILLCSLQLVKEIFVLSMRVMDAIESFSLSPTTRNESVNEFFVNGTKSLDILVENKAHLLSALKDNEEIISKILEGINPQYNVKELIAGVSKAMKTVETIQGGVKAVTSLGGGVIVKAANHGVFNFLCALGVSEHAPNFLDVKPDTSFENYMAEPKPLTEKEKLARQLAEKRTDWPVSQRTKAYPSSHKSAKLKS